MSRDLHPGPLRFVSAFAAHRDALLAYFRQLSTAPAVLARRLLGQAHPDDEDLADHLIRHLRRRSSMDGSIDHQPVPTARALRQLVDLGAPTDHAAVVRLAGFLLGRQNAPGRWGEADGRGAGFFSPGPVDHPTAPLATPTGVTISDETEARFAVSCIVLRSILRAGLDERPAVRAHVSSLGTLGPHGVVPILGWLAVSALAVAAPDQRDVGATWVRHLLSSGKTGHPVHELDALGALGTTDVQPALRERLETVTPVTPETSEEAALILTRALAAVGAAR